MSRKKVIVSPISQRNILKNFGYEAGKVLGTGTYSKVYVVTDQTRKKLACKVVRKKDAGDAFITKFLPRELKIVANIKHPNIVQVYQVIDTKQSVYMLMDFCEKGDLLEYIRMHGPFAVEKCKSIFKQVVDAVHYLHNLDVAHRDIKCENVFLTQKGSAKLGDFGFSRYCKDKAGEDLMSNTFCGSKAYAAPEILRGQFYDPKKYDIWSLGVVLYVMLTATMPFDDTRPKQMLKSQLSNSIKRVTAFWDDCPKNVKDLQVALLEQDVKQRIDIANVVEHSWFKGDAISKIKQRF
ncbi:unnamed protein product [Acanthoscelides obtectus]|uniref:Protein kinase domain-containing protein n=1 Tax=Acanthoscelides obtectus TaxID=200917 RepID=A0A9P0Q2Q4_ACAOB|nr:unnamed protein product [Acanthoscelides obtectus]CAK1677016.1 Testis-specific serine/threonine-protein kinase 1 [Acanthoscelides obtectus]